MQKENRSFVFESDCQMRSLQGKTVLMKDEDVSSAILLSVFDTKIYTKSLNLPFQSGEFTEELQP